MSISPEQIKSLIRCCTVTAAVKYSVSDKRPGIVHYMKYHSALSYLGCFIYFLYSDIIEQTLLNIKLNKDLISP